MQNGDFTLTWEPKNRLILSCHKGFWTVETAERYSAELLQMLQSIPPGSCDMIADLTEHPVQSREVNEVMARLARDLANNRIRQAVGIITGSVIARMQFERVSTTVPMRFVASETEARTLLATLNDGKA